MKFLPRLSENKREEWLSQLQILVSQVSYFDYMQHHVTRSTRHGSHDYQLISLHFLHIIAT